MRRLVFALVIGVGPIWSAAQTNQMWLKPFPNLPKDAHSFAEWRALIEQRSAQVEGEGKGLAFVGNPPAWLLSDTHPPVSITGATNDVSFVRVLELVASVCQVKFRIVDDTAVLGQEQYRYLLLAYSGRCRDAETGKPLTNITIEAEGAIFPSRNLVVDSSGRFTCGVPHIFHFITSPTVTASVFTDDGFPNARQVLRVKAPGYRDCLVTNDVWDWRTQWAGSVLDIALEPEGKSAANKAPEDTSLRADPQR